jgi:dihydrofolate reductase
VHGSANLIQTLIRNNLVDRYRLWVFPVVLGSGKRLFADGTVPSALKLRQQGLDDRCRDRHPQAGRAGRHRILLTLE